MNLRVSVVQTSIALLALASSSLSYANNAYEFDLSMISRELGVELSEEDFQRLKDESLTGRHEYDIYVNTHNVGLQNVEIYREDASKEGYSAKIQAKVLQQLPLKFDELPHLLELPSEQYVEQLTELIPGSTLELDTAMQALYLTVPQVYFDEKKRVLLNPVLWDYGIPALRFEYNFDSSLTKYLGGTSERAFLSANMQLNLGAWRLINRSTVRYSNLESTEFERLNTYATRVIAPLKARLTMGEITTYSRFMDSVPIIGVNLRDEEELIEPADRDYLPSISGIANSQSLVTVRQGDKILAQREVPPGPFEFSDIVSLGYSGEVEVEVKDASGQTKTWVVPYIRSNRLLKTGRFVWSAAAGRFDGYKGQDNPWVITASGGYGMPGGYTLSGGVIASDIFQHLRAGVVTDWGNWGSFSLALDHSQKDHHQQTRKGSAADLNWSKSFKRTNSSINFGYRRTIDGTIGSLSEAASLNRNDPLAADWGENDFVVDRFVLSVSQSLGKYGSLSASGIYEKSDQGNQYQSLSANYSVSINNMILTTLLQHKNQQQEGMPSQSDWQVNVNLSIPLSIFESRSYFRNPNIGIAATFDEEGRSSESVSIGGGFGDTSPFYYDLQYQKARRGDPSYRAALSYIGDKANIQWDVSKSGHQKHFGMNANGSLLLTQYGFYATQQNSGAMALVHVKDAHDLQLGNSSQAKGDEWAVISSLSNYRKNTIKLNPNSLPSNMMLADGFSVDVCPADGAVLFHEFKNFIGTQALLTAITDTGEVIPFGSEVILYENGEVRDQTVSDEGGVVYFTALPPESSMRIRWRDQDEIKMCHSQIKIDSQDYGNDDLYRGEVICEVENKVDKSHTTKGDEQ